MNFKMTRKPKKNPDTWDIFTACFSAVMCGIAVLMIAFFIGKGYFFLAIMIFLLMCAVIFVNYKFRN